MKATILKVKSSPNSLVTNLESPSKDGQVRRFVGRKYDPSLGTNGGWLLKDEPEEIPYRAEYVQAVKEGDLIAADKATADICGVPFTAKK